MHYLRKLKILGLLCLYYLGALHVLFAIRFRKNVLFLTYHRVLTPEQLRCSNSSAGMVVTTAAFAKHLSFISRFMNPITLDEFEESVYQDFPLPPRSCVITFDDGWKDNYDNALPLLTQFGLPATIFISTYFISNCDTFWQEKFRATLRALRDLKSIGEFADTQLASLIPPDLSDEAVQKFIDLRKQFSQKDNDNLIKSIRSRLPRAALSKTYDDMLEWNDVLEMRKKGISFGSHGCTHTPLVLLTDDDCTTELYNSRIELQVKSGQQIRAIAYPNGDFDNRVLGLSKKAGYRLGFTTIEGRYSSDMDPIAIPRINIHEARTSSISLFLAAIVGLN